MQGWISLHRKLVEWEWYSDANTMRLFVHCLLKANHADKKWRGIDVSRGQFLTSIDSLSKELRLSSQKIRTSISKLKSTGEITIKTTSKYSMISIACYDSYQGDNKQESKQTTNKQQTNNKQITTTNNDNNDNNDNNVNNEKNDNKSKDAALAIFTEYGFSEQQIKLIYDNRTKNSKSAKSAKITEIIAKSICKEMKLCTDAGYTIDNVLNEWHETSWVAFKAEWIQKRIPLNNNAGNHNGQDQFKRHTKPTAIQQAATDRERLRAAIAAHREGESFVGLDDQTIRTQIHNTGGDL